MKRRKFSTERRTEWLAAIIREDLTENILENDRVCGTHFHSGKAASLWDRYNPDWIPTLHLGHGKVRSEGKKEHQQLRAQRVLRRGTRERERLQVKAMQRKVVKLYEPGEKVRDVDVDTEASEEEDADASTRSCGTQTDECDYMFRSTKS